MADILRQYIEELITDTSVKNNIAAISTAPYIWLLSLLTILVTFPNIIGLS